ncbi:MAG: prepilin-type N-terminal cleavage/methylation domain-containing protein [Pseudomonadales bacterium]|nr:prepilin-type N-terminal cleavage/methylation domain-containing protein [Pseudomonadales bacterium]
MRTRNRANAACSRRAGGFTLIELMIAVVILAIVAAVALPLYTQYSMRTYRAEVQADLMTCAQALERFAAQNFNYAGAVLADLCEPMSVRQGRYAIALDVPVADPNRFTLTATPADPGPMAGDGILTYDDAGRRAWDRNNNGVIAADEATWQD